MKTIHIFLKSFNKGSHVITVTDRMMDLDGQGQEALAVPLEELTHGKNREQELAVVKHIDVKPSKLQPGDHGNVERVSGCSILRRIAGGLGILLRIRLIALQESLIVLRKIGPDTREILILLVKHRVHGVHIIIDARAIRCQNRTELWHIIDGLGQQPNHGRIQFLPLQVRDVDIDHSRIGADPFNDEMLVELLAFPAFQIY